MKAQLIFDLPEDQHDFDNAINGTKYAAAIFQAYTELRSILKHETGIPEKVYGRLEVIKEDLSEFT